MNMNEKNMGHILKCHDIVKTDFVRGENCFLYDSQGKKYIDFESGCWCAALGFNHPRIQRVIETQVAKVIHLGTRYPSDLVERAAIAVLDIVGFGDGKCTFLSSGSEAVEFGVQAARLFSGKPRLLTFATSYLAAYGSAGKKRTDEWFLYDFTSSSLARCDATLNEIPFEEIGAFVFEAGGSSPGFVRFPPVALVQELARRVRQAGGLIVSNEITTGMGRTGRWFGFQHYDLQPDIVALGKGLGNGYPVSVVAMKPAVARGLEDAGLHYAQSHQNDPLGVAVALEVIDILKEEKWVERGNEIGSFFLTGLIKLGEKHAVVKEARGRGMLLALELHPHERVNAEWVYDSLLAEGFLAGFQTAGNIVRFDPPLILTKEDVEQILSCLDKILAEAEG